VTRHKPPHSSTDRHYGENIPESNKIMKFLCDPNARRTLGFHEVMPLSTTCWSLRICGWDHSQFGGGKAREESGPFGDGLRGVGWRFNRGWFDVETYFVRHEHNSCAAEILRAFLWFNQATMAVIIFSPPYFFSALHSSRLDSRLFYSRVPSYRLPIYRGKCLQSQFTKAIFARPSSGVRSRMLS
jgi:hypothetical protein